MNHTPAPWKVGAWTSRGQMIRGPKGQFIGFAQGYPEAISEEYSIPEPESEANARLISQAPAMAEALKAIAAKKPKRKPEWSEDTGQNLDDAYSNGYDICAWENAELAEQVLRDAGVDHA